MTAMWDGFQREMLAALGHVVYRSAASADTGSMPAGGESLREDASKGAHRPLLRALARAAGVSPERLPQLPPLSQLRSAAAKRAVWPALRALRRPRPG